MYACPRGTDASILLLEGASELVVSYKYELTTYTAADVPSAIERVQAAMLANIARQTGLGHCGNNAGSSSSQALGINDSSWRRRRQLMNTLASDDDGGAPFTARRLRTGGRGSNNIVGVSSTPLDEIATDLTTCRGDPITITGVDFASTRVEEVSPGWMGSVVIMGSEEFEPEQEEQQSSESNADDGEGADSEGAGEEGAASENSAYDAYDDAPARPDNDFMDILVLSSTRIDGGEVIVDKAVQRGHNGKANPNNPHRHDNEKLKNEAEGEDEEDADGAFGYLSTQSLPVEKSSHSSHNPLTASSSSILQPRKQVDTRLGEIVGGDESSSSSSSSSLPSPTEVIRTWATACTVIEGHMTVYVTSSPEESYENLKCRITAAIASDVNAHGLQGYKNDIVLGVQMYEEEEDSDVVTGVDDGMDSNSTEDTAPTTIIPEEDATTTTTEQNPGYVSAAVQGGLSTREDSSSGFTSQMGILAGLGGLLLVLIALFVRTSHPRRKEKKRIIVDINNTNSFESSFDRGTYADDDVEMKLTPVQKTLKKMKTFDERIRKMATFDEQASYQEHEDSSGGVMDDDYSVGAFSVKSANENEQQQQQASSLEDPRHQPRSKTLSPMRKLLGKKSTRSYYGGKNHHNNNNSSNNPSKQKMMQNMAKKSNNKDQTQQQLQQNHQDVLNVTNETILEDLLQVEKSFDEDHFHTDNNNTNNSGGCDAAAPIKSYFGLFAPRTCVTGRNNEVEMDVQSVYDCDDHSSLGVGVDTESNDTDGVTNLVSSGPLPPRAREGSAARSKSVNGDADASLDVVTAAKSWLGGLFFGGAAVAAASSATPKRQRQDLESGGKKPSYHDEDDEDDVKLHGDPVDVDGMMDDEVNDIIRATVPRNRPETPTFSPGCAGVACNDNDNKKGSNTSNKRPARAALLRFFTARERGDVKPHSEVEASLRPFDDCSEYSSSVAREEGRPRARGTEVEPNYFFGNCGGTDDRRILFASDQPPKSRIVRKFGNKIMRRARSLGGGNQACGGLDIQEVHEIYVCDNKEKNMKKKKETSRHNKKSSGRETPVYMIQKKPSSLRPEESYKSPTALHAIRSRSQLSEAPGKAYGANVVTPEKDIANELDCRYIMEIGDDDDNTMALVPMCNMFEDYSWVPDCLR